MGFVEADLKNAGVKLGDLLVALSDGVGVDDMDEGTAFLVALSNVADDLAEDLDSAVLEILSGLTDRLGDARRDVVPV